MATSSPYQCSLKQCQNKDINDSGTRVEVCTVMSSKSKAKFVIDWSHKGEAVFHQECFQDVLTSARARNSKRAKIKIIEAEKKMIKEGAKTFERHDGIDVVREESRRIADLIRAADHCVVFTGAGISTPAGIGDYRGKSGKWTQDDRAGVVVDEDEGPSPKVKRTEDAEDDGDSDEEVNGVPYEDLRPTYTHEALKQLVDVGHIKYVISQNGDGLHTLSGIALEHISELHGNVFIERCESCGHRYQRPTYVLDDVASQYYEEMSDYGKTDVIKPKYAVQCTLCGLSHSTGKKCTQKGCKGKLMDTIINFRDNLEESILDRAMENTRKSDLMLCLGSTLQVTPACDLVEMGKEPLRLVICNRQKTPFDKLCTEKDSKTKKPIGSRVFGDCDLLMREVMKCILSQETLHDWEGQRDVRLHAYNKLRKGTKK